MRLRGLRIPSVSRLGGGDDIAMASGRLTIEPGKILIIKPSSLGDILHSLPFLNAVKSRFPRAVIHWVVAKGFEGLLAEHPMIDHLWVINKDAWKKIRHLKGTIGELQSLFGNLRKERYDLVVDLQGLLRSGIITAATASPMRVGFKEAREGSNVFYTDRIKGGKDIHAVDRYLKMADYLGCDTSEISFPFPALPDEIPMYEANEPYAVIIPGARWETKRWPPEKFGKLASLLPLKSVIVGGKGDRAIAEEVGSSSKGKASSLAGKTSLQELAGILKNARLVICNDSGPMHIAAALGIPVFAVFGPTDPVRTGPYGKGHSIIRSDVVCAPCFKKRCADMKCMKDLSVAKVLDAIKGRL